MMTIMVISYLLTWISIIYSLLTAKVNVELWGEEAENVAE